MRMLVISLLALMLGASPAFAGPRYALIRPDGSIERLDSNVDPKVGVRAGWKWLPAPLATPPEYDAATQVLTGPTRTVGATQVTESYSVRSKSAAELSADKDDSVRGMGVPALRALCHLKNEIRTKVESLPSWTQAECFQAFKGLLP